MPADRHADERERRRRKARYGMQMSGRSVRLLARLAASGGSKRPSGGVLNKRKKRPRR